jgi:hypothetical protein
VDVGVCVRVRVELVYIVHTTALYSESDLLHTDSLSIIVPKLKTTFCIFLGGYNTLWLAGLALV